MSDTEQREFKIGDVEYVAKQPTPEQYKEARKLRAQVWKEAFQNGDLLRDQLDDELRKRALWNDERETKFQTLKKEILEYEFMLKQGGIKLSKARELAILMRDKREDMVRLLSTRTDLDSNTCEGKADSANFNYLVSCCIVKKETGERLFNDLDHYLALQNTGLGSRAAQEFYYLISGTTEHSNSRLPENKFLKKFKFVNDKLELIDKDGRMVDEEGRHIDEFGNYIKWTDENTYIKVDIEGKPLNETGDYNVDHQPFLDEDGSPIDESIFDSDNKPEVKTAVKEVKKKTKKGVSDNVDA